MSLNFRVRQSNSTEFKTISLGISQPISELQPILLEKLGSPKSLDYTFFHISSKTGDVSRLSKNDKLYSYDPNNEDIIEIRKLQKVIYVTLLEKSLSEFNILDTTSINVKKLHVDFNIPLKDLLQTINNEFGLGDVVYSMHYIFFDKNRNLLKEKWLSLDRSLENQRVPFEAHIALYPFLSRHASTSQHLINPDKSAILHRQDKKENYKKVYAVLERGILYLFKNDITAKKIVPLEFYNVRSNEDSKKKVYF
jgi:hypothetical protein